MIDSALVLVLLLVGAWGVATRRNLVKKVMALGILTTAIVALFVTLGSTIGITAPIILEGTAETVDPLPQALMLTAIVVGVCVTALALVLVERLHRRTGSTSIAAIERRDGDREEDRGG
ncbi:MAG TPA: cation:proton antiporter subunit C [Desulfobacterales bacterium]|nr:cation:proton antiporter subunit C [Desulfobacterales bacterium]